jgi:hypothetical protein
MGSVWRRRVGSGGLSWDAAASIKCLSASFVGATHQPSRIHDFSRADFTAGDVLLRLGKRPMGGHRPH